jgi:hypothetical protein
MVAMVVEWTRLTLSQNMGVDAKSKPDGVVHNAWTTRSLVQW